MKMRIKAPLEQISSANEAAGSIHEGAGKQRYKGASEKMHVDDMVS